MRVENIGYVNASHTLIVHLVRNGIKTVGQLRQLPTKERLKTKLLQTSSPIIRNELRDLIEKLPNISDEELINKNNMPIPKDIGIYYPENIIADLALKGIQEEGTIIVNGVPALTDIMAKETFYHPYIRTVLLLRYKYLFPIENIASHLCMSDDEVVESINVGLKRIMYLLGMKGVVKCSEKI